MTRENILQKRHVFGVIAWSILAAGLMAQGCGSDRAALGARTDKDAGVDPSGRLGGGSGDEPDATGLRGRQVSCSNGQTTSLTGKVYAPNGKLPLYNAIVYVPNAPLAPFTRGATCERCGTVSGDPIVTALTKPDGSFVLENVPVGKDIPLVVQLGKWRRQVTLPSEVQPCVDNPLVDPNLTRLPKNQSEGSMPQIALTTGGCDNLGCVLPKIGIDPSEFGVAADGASKAVHTYVGEGSYAARPGEPPGATPAKDFWSSAANLAQYDVALLSCECREAREGQQGGLSTKNDASFAAMADYLKAGGRIFTTDFMYSWYKFSPDPGLQAIGSIRGAALPGETPMTIDKSFAKGQALVDWLEIVAPGTNGKVAPDAMFSNFVSADATKTQVWASSATNGIVGPGPRVLTTNVPVGAPAEEQCGKAVHIDAHVNRTVGDGAERVDENYPNSCPGAMKDAEHLLAFFFFDLSACIQSESAPPQPPAVN